MEATQAQITVRAPLSVVMGIIADLPAYPEWTLGVASPTFRPARMPMAYWA